MVIRLQSPVMVVRIYNVVGLIFGIYASFFSNASLNVFQCAYHPPLVVPGDMSYELTAANAISSFRGKLYYRVRRHSSASAVLLVTEMAQNRLALTIRDVPALKTAQPAARTCQTGQV